MINKQNNVFFYRFVIFFGLFLFSPVSIFSVNYKQNSYINSQSSTDFYKGNKQLIDYPNGKYKGNMKNNKRNGKGKFLYFNGDYYEGDWVDDKREGEGIFKINRNGSIYGVYEGEFKNDLFDGKGILTTNGKPSTKYKGYFKNGSFDGKGILIKEGIETYKGDWLKGEKNGRGLYKNNKGFWCAGVWKNGERIKTTHTKWKCIPALILSFLFFAFFPIYYRSKHKDKFEKIVLLSFLPLIIWWLLAFIEYSLINRFNIDHLNFRVFTWAGFFIFLFISTMFYLCIGMKVSTRATERKLMKKQTAKDKVLGEIKSQYDEVKKETDEKKKELDDLLKKHENVENFYSELANNFTIIIENFKEYGMDYHRSTKDYLDNLSKFLKEKENVVQRNKACCKFCERSIKKYEELYKKRVNNYKDLQLLKGSSKDLNIDIKTEIKDYAADIKEDKNTIRIFKDSLKKNKRDVDSVFKKYKSFFDSLEKINTFYEMVMQKNYINILRNNNYKNDEFAFNPLIQGLYLKVIYESNGYQNIGNYFDNCKEKAVSLLIQYTKYSIREGEYDNAVNALKKAISGNKNISPIVYYYLGLTEYYKNNWEEAKELFNQYIDKLNERDESDKLKDDAPEIDGLIKKCNQKLNNNPEDEKTEEEEEELDMSFIDGMDEKGELIKQD